ncbi:MAG: glycosyltransferase [Phototrophicaceae bacterium]
MYLSLQFNSLPLIVITIYNLCLILLAYYTFAEILLLIGYFFKRNRPFTQASSSDLPTLTVQLPIYNERAVVEQLLTAVFALQYPADRLTIQILDDSTDETTQLIQQMLKLSTSDATVQHIRRPNRVGYKAGALTYGMTQSVTDYYAIFDSDFIPAPSFLLEIFPYLLEDSRLGMVQGRWGHSNPYDNALTQAQSLLIDLHFEIEQTGRSSMGLLHNFNGSAGVWRAECIHQSGGWSAATLTEDLDLSYRAQLNGWKMRTVSSLVVPAELPASMTAYKQQQRRWALGSTQCLQLHLVSVWKAKHLSLFQKIMASIHLGQYLPQPAIFTLLLVTPLALQLGLLDEAWGLPGILGFLLPLMLIISQRPNADGWRRLLAFPMTTVLGTGLTLNNSLAFIAAFFSHDVEFQRTPKQGQRKAISDYRIGANLMVVAELVMGIYLLFGAWLALEKNILMLPHMFITGISYLIIALWTLWDNRRPTVELIRRVSPTH